MEIRFIDNLYEKGQKKNLIYPNFIYNRLDLFCNSYDLFEIKDETKSIYIEVGYISEEKAYIGVWLVPITKKALLEISSQVFKRHKKVRYIHFEYSFSKIGYFFNKNHYRICLPNTVEQIQARLSSKGRYNIKREKILIEKNIGHCIMEEYTIPTIPSKIIDLYFKMKRNTHGIQYNMTTEEYIKFYHVTNCYVLKAKDKILAILLSCEYPRMVVYIENMTYSEEYQKYSPGQVLYDMFLAKLIEKEFKEIFLAGGTTSYKKRYGGIEDITYCGIIFRSWFRQFLYTIKQKIHKFIQKTYGILYRRKK